MREPQAILLHVANHSIKLAILSLQCMELVLASDTPHHAVLEVASVQPVMATVTVAQIVTYTETAVKMSTAQNV